ncbi:MAG: hypothetical protein ABJH08_11325 [Balneola sp.]
MNIKHYINKFVAILALATLVSGFQFNNAQGAMVNLESAVGIEEAYAGPCGNRGCDGQPVYCDSYVVFEVGGVQVIRHCNGKKRVEIE